MCPRMTLMNIVWFGAEPLSVMLFIAYLAATIHKFRILYPIAAMPSRLFTRMHNM